MKRIFAGLIVLGLVTPGVAGPKPAVTSLATNTWYFIAWDSETLFPVETYRPFPQCCRVRIPSNDEMAATDANGLLPAPSAYGKALPSLHLAITDPNGAWLTVLDTLVPGDVFGFYLGGTFQGYSSAVPDFAFENWDYGERTWNPVAALVKPDLSRGRFWIPPGESDFLVRTVAPGHPAASGGYGWLRVDNATPPKAK
jgi:hypothetical protein